VRAHLSGAKDPIRTTEWVFCSIPSGFSPCVFLFLESAGVQTDAIYTEGQGYDLSFDTLWGTAGRVTKDGYIVFFAIPFKSLRFSHGPEQTWGSHCIAPSCARASTTTGRT